MNYHGQILSKKRFGSKRIEPENTTFLKFNFNCQFNVKLFIPSLIPLILSIGIVPILFDDVSAQEDSKENERKESAIVEWNKDISRRIDVKNFDLEKTHLVINEIQILSKPKLILIDFILENNGNKTIHLFRSGSLEIRTFDPIKYEQEPRRKSPSFENSYEYLIPERIKWEFDNIDFTNRCERLDRHIDPGESIRGVICFNPKYENFLPYPSSSLEYYLVFTNDKKNSCPFCKLVLLNDKVTDVVPNWTKNTTKYGSFSQISDKEFTRVLDYLLQNRSIRISENQSSERLSEYELPSWFKKNVEWWHQGLITDQEFAKNIQWLVDNLKH